MVIFCLFISFAPWSPEYGPAENHGNASPVLKETVRGGRAPTKSKDNCAYIPFAFISIVRGGCRIDDWLSQRSWDWQHAFVVVCSTFVKTNLGRERALTAQSWTDVDPVAWISKWNRAQRRLEFERAHRDRRVSYSFGFVGCRALLVCRKMKRTIFSTGACRALVLADRSAKGEPWAVRSASWYRPGVQGWVVRGWPLFPREGRLYGSDGATTLLTISVDDWKKETGSQASVWSMFSFTRLLVAHSRCYEISWSLKRQFQVRACILDMYEVVA